MARVKVKLMRPLNGQAVGTVSEYDEGDAKRLEATGAVKITGKAGASSPETKMEAAPSNKAASPDPFDHDGDGKPGGSAKGSQSTRAIGAAKKKGA